MAPEEMPPDEPGRYEAGKKSSRHNPVLFGFGIGLTALGGFSVFAGLASIFVVTAAGGKDYTGSIVAITGGFVVTGIGIPMIVIGGRKRGLNSSSSPGRSTPSWVGAPHGAGWVWTF